MFRYLVAWLPSFRLERCGWTSDRAVVLVAEQQSALRVQALSPAAARAGLRAGMTVAQARAVLPELQVEPLDAEAEAQDLRELALQLQRLGPQVGPLPPDALVLDVGTGRRGPQGLRPAGAERVLMERARLRLRQLGHDAIVVIADDPGVARACARWGRRSRRIPPGQGPQAMAELPLAALELPPAELALLLGQGLRTVGAFAALPPASLVGRLSPEALAAHALARGQGPRPLLPAPTADPPLAFQQDLPDPVEERQALLFVLNALVRRASAELLARDLAAVRLLLRLQLDPPDEALAAPSEQEIALRLGSPSRDPQHLLRLLDQRLERVELAGPVIGVHLRLAETCPFHGRQRDLLERQRAEEALDEAVARLQDELGEAAVRVPVGRARHLPEQAWQELPWTGPTRAPDPADWTDQLARRRAEGDDPVRAWQGFAPPPAPLRPALLLRPALGAEVQARTAGPGLGERPQALHLDGRWQPLSQVRGPERLRGGWWEQPFDRDYWVATLPDGRRAWLYQEEGHWLLHGWFDGP